MNEHLITGAARFAACKYGTATKCRLDGYPVIDCIICENYDEAAEAALQNNPEPEGSAE